MTRVVCIDESCADVVAKCSQKNIIISTIEELQSGGTRIILQNVRDAETLATAYGKKVITGPVTRMDMRFRNTDNYFTV